MQHFRLSRTTLTLVATALAGQALRAQTPLYTFNGTSGDQHGRSVAPAGDVNNDGYDDVLVGAPLDDPTGANSGRVVVYSGKTGAALLVINGAAAGDEFGFSVDGVGDIDHDGFDDFVVGAPSHDFGASDGGLVSVYSGKTGATLRQWFGFQANAFFGSAVAGAGDVNNDGYVDVIVGTPHDDSNGADSGRVRVFSGLTGGVLHTIDGDAAGNEFGYSVDGVGDVNNDGYDDFIVGAPNYYGGGDDAGIARVYSGAAGWVTHEFNSGEPHSHFGRSVAGLGDVNGDSDPDFAIGAPDSDYHAVDGGRVSVFSGAGGTELHRVSGGAGTHMGTSVAGVGDVNDDGHNDFMVGAPQWNFLSSDEVGLVRVYSGDDASSLHTFLGGSEGDQLGIAIAGAGDVNGDGTPDIVAAAPYSDGNGSNAGYARVWLMDAPLPTAYCTAKTNSLGCTPHIGASGIPSLHTANTFHVTASSVRNNKAGMLFWSLQSSGLPFHGGTICVSPPFIRTAAQYSGGSALGDDCTGTYDFFFSQSYMSAIGLQAGHTVKAQYWSRDPGFAYPNNVGLTNAVSFEVLY